MKWRSAIASIRQLARTLGPMATAGYVVARLLDRASRGRLRLISYRFVAQPVPVAGEPAMGRGGNIELRWLQFEDPLVGQFPRPPAVIRKRFTDGARCLAAVKSDRLVGFLWYKEGEYVEDEVRCSYRFDPTTAVWDFDVHIEPEFRLGRLFARLWDVANRELRAAGHRWTISRISSFNAASLAAHSRLGARRIGTAVFFVAGPLQVLFATIAPYFHIGWREDMRPVFYLDTR